MEALWKKPIPVSVLIRLMKSVHIKGNSYTFKQCEKVFTCSNHLNIYEEIHIGEKSWACKHLGKAFSDLSSHNIHEWSHTFEKPYSCKYCAKPFTNFYSCKHCVKPFTNFYSWRFMKELILKRSVMDVHIVKKHLPAPVSWTFRKGFHLERWLLHVNVTANLLTLQFVLICTKNNHTGEELLVCKRCENCSFCRS